MKICLVLKTRWRLGSWSEEEKGESRGEKEDMINNCHSRLNFGLCWTVNVKPVTLDSHKILKKVPSPQCSTLADQTVSGPLFSKRLY